MAELTGQGWWVVSVTLRRRSGWTAALQAARGLYAANNPGNGGMNRRIGFATTETLSTTECTDLEFQFSQWYSVFQWFEKPPWPINLKTGCGGRDRTGDTRRMKPLPCHLATPLLWENWHGVPVLPRTRKVLETPLRKLTPAVWYISK